MQELDATQFRSGFPHLLIQDKHGGTVSLVHDGAISVGDKIKTFGVVRDVVEILEERPAKGHYSPRKNEEFTFYKLATK